MSWNKNKPFTRLILMGSLLGFSLSPLSGAQANSEYPRTSLDNGLIEVSIFLPDAQRGYYRGSRFDWSGIIEQVRYRGHRFFGPLHASHDPTLHDAVSGPADEFAMNHPMGFDEAAPGETFVKIGVGLLIRPDTEEYRFHRQYELARPGDWVVEQGDGRVRFTQELDGDRGWAYRYSKTLSLAADRPELLIEYTLENTGRKRIDLDHYNHNFTIIDDLPYGPDYSVEFPFGAAEPVEIKPGLAWFRDNRIDVLKALGSESLWIPVYEGSARTDYNAATVRNQRSGAALAISGDAAVHRMVFWAVERAACPEPFSRIRLNPGESKTWASRYRFIAGDE